MAVQTRAQLQTKSATVQNETAPNANTAARVGGLFDDFADSVTINGERGYATMYINSPTGFETDDGNAILLETPMTQGEYAGTIFSVSDFTMTYTGATSASVRVAVLLSFSGINNREYIFYIAKNGNVISQSACQNTTQGTHAHSAFSEAFMKADPNDIFSVYVFANTSSSMTVESLTFSAFTI